MDIAGLSVSVRVRGRYRLAMSGSVALVDSTERFSEMPAREILDLPLWRPWRRGDVCSR